MNALGWILILLLILVIGVGIFLLIWYFVKIRNKNNTPGPTGPPTPTPPPQSQPLSILTGAGKPEYAVTTNLSNTVIINDPSGPIGPTGSSNPTVPSNPIGIGLPIGVPPGEGVDTVTGVTGATGPVSNLFVPNVCSRYTWSYSGGTGPIGPLSGVPGPTGSTGTTAVVLGGTGGYLQANWNSNNYLLVNTSTAPKAGDTLNVGPTGPSVNSTWIFVPDTPSSVSGKWCLRQVNDKLLCMHYTTGPTGLNQPLTIQEFRLNNPINTNDKGFVFNNNTPLTTETTPTCNAG